LPPPAPLPQPSRPPPRAVCPARIAGCVVEHGQPPEVCFPDPPRPCCFCKITTIPPSVRCPNSCPDDPRPPPPPPGPNVPFQAVCDTTTTFSLTLGVFANTCGD
jgi:hypothetical protein